MTILARTFLNHLWEPAESGEFVLIGEVVEP